MRKLWIFTCVAACLFAQAAYSEGQAQGKVGTSSGTQSLAGNALANMDNTFNDLESEMTMEDAYFLGRAVAANILATYKPYTRDQEMTRYVNRICRTIAINSPQPEVFNGYHVIVLDSPELNAFASPGGHILITKGLVEATASEDMLAAVIAHEFAHILLMHGVGIVADMRLNNDLTSTADRASGIASRASPVAARAVLLRNSVTKLVDVMVKSGYSQAQEFEADTAAITLLAASGYNPGALMDMLKILQQKQGGSKIGLGATHPTPDARIANADKMTGRYRVQDTTSYRAPRFKKTLSK